ncbi:cation:proton antiporter [Terrilactibacillus sp. S3-3]|nr:cation:proton antiporter [Terrilactibacillus sp. S3-3]
MQESPLVLVSGAIFILLFLFGYFGRKRVPSIILYILLGIVLGGHISSNEILELAGKVGIILLFFLLGLEFPISKLGETAKKVWPGGLLDIAVSLFVPYFICLFFGIDPLTAFLISGIVYATSSSITAKLLESTKRMANLESEYVLGLLIFFEILSPRLSSRF